MNRKVFTNGCFDILHAGHVYFLEKAKSLGDKLIVGINSDDSVRSIKGPERPVNSEIDRANVLLGLRAVDEVRVFKELTPENLIKEINPNVLVKGGDWKESEIIGAEFVKQNGGEVFSIPFLEGYSTTDIISKLDANSQTKKSADTYASDNEIIVGLLKNRSEVFEKVLSEQVENIERSAELIFEAFSNGNKILLCGNGGSAADAQHIAAEFVGRYETERKALPAIALTTDTSILTAVSNDYGFEKVFTRQVQGLGKKGDILIAFSTSGTSPNIIGAIMTARNAGMKIIGLTGSGGKKMAALCDVCMLISAHKTSRIQEAHITIGHILCELIDSKLNGWQNSK